MNNLIIRKVKESDLNQCFDIENVSYEGDEAAGKEKISKRIRTYPEGFIVLEIDNKIAGFINCGATDKIELSDEEFKELVGHNPNGKHIVIMSVVIHPDYQGKGHAGILMKHFINKMIDMEKESIYLICQTRLIKMYEKQGFKYIGESESDHGGLKWHEMVLRLPKIITNKN